MAIPLERVNVARLKKACTISYLPMGEPEPLLLEAFRLDKQYIHVPRQLGIQVCRRQGIEWEDQTTTGSPVVFPRIPQPRDYQVEALEDVGAAQGDYYDFLFRARTGWGKTIGSLIIAARLGLPTLVIVDQENLKDQWIKALKEHFGMTDANIGLIQGKVVKFKGCPVTIAMVQTLSQKTFAREVYDHFGFVIVDEVHIIGAPTFSKPLLEFSAAYRMGVSATPKRRDGLQKVLDYNLGKVRVWIDDEHEENAVWIAEHDSVYSWYATTSPKSGRFVTEVSEDASRNLLIAEATCHLYDTGRDIVVMSDRIEQLTHLMTLCEYLGIPAEEMGVYAGESRSYGYDKEPNPLRRPLGYQRGIQYTPISLQLIAKKVKKPALTRIKEHARILFATYGMFAKGVDVPRLNGGVDASPRSQAEQMHGRILRLQKGKLSSIWITIKDRCNYRSLHGLSARIPDYLRNNARLFHWSLDEGETPCNAKALKVELLDEVTRQKLMRIEKNRDGLLTLVTQSDQATLVKQRVSAITERRNPAPPRRVSRTVSSPAARTVRSLARDSKSLSFERPSPSPRRLRR